MIVSNLGFQVSNCKFHVANFTDGSGSRSELNSNEINEANADSQSVQRQDIIRETDALERCAILENIEDLERCASLEAIDVLDERMLYLLYFRFHQNKGVPLSARPCPVI